MRTHTVVRAIGVSYTACKDEFDKIFDLTAGVYCYFYHTFFYTGLALDNELPGVRGNMSIAVIVQLHHDDCNKSYNTYFSMFLLLIGTLTIYAGNNFLPWNEVRTYTYISTIANITFC